MAHVATLVLLLPMAGFLVVLLLGSYLDERGIGAVATGVVALSFAGSVVMFVQLLGDSNRQVSVHLFTWISVGGLKAPASLLIDPLSVTMCLFVTGISALIHLYSIGYMAGERDYRKFFLYLNLFVFSMLLLVMAGNLVLTFVGWEGVGVCSYWLVSYYFDRDTAASAGKKAFIYNRVGDVGLLAAMFLIFSRLHTLTYLGIFGRAGTLSPTVATLVVLALLLGATGKSAQIPLFNWLPDAMEGPTPVSALIHAATMVTAGVYLLCRMAPVLALSSSGRLTIAVIGAATAFVAATIACAQRDIKKVLAFSTISQIGYMVLAVGAGAYSAAIFLMVSHAFFKALLFLGSGSVIHSLGGEQDMGRMGGLARYLPLTFPTFLVGWLTIAGVPPFAGFFAKGEVLTNAYHYSKPLWALGVVTAMLTGYYMSRLFVLTFRGTERFREATHGHDPHESPWVMTLPLVVLAALSAVGGLLDLPWAHGRSLAAFVDPAFGYAPAAVHTSTGAQWALAGVDVVVALVGLAAAFAIWRDRASDPRLEPAFLQRVWRWDDAYDAAIARPLMAAGALAGDVVEPLVIDGAVRGLAGGVRRSAEGVRKAQSGFVRQYALAMALGMAVLVVYVVARAG
jgi:NADH-quinone oxidoreductase subunit L